MSDPERLLSELFAADEPPERDPDFVLEVMERLERRRLLLDLAALAPVTAAAGAVLWAAGPVLRAAIEPIFAGLGDLALAEAAAALTLAALVWIWTGGRPQPSRI